jgi:hypothetical protein
VQGAGCRVQGAEFRIQGSGFRVQGSGFRVQGSGCRVEMYYTNAILLLVWFICVVIFVAQKLVINTSMEIKHLALSESG